MKTIAILNDGQRRFPSVAAGLVAGALVLATALVDPAAAQTAASDTKELHRRTMMFTGQFSDEPIESAIVYTVPANRSFRITDLILTSYTNAFCDITIGGTYEIRLQPNSTLPLSFQSGPTFGPGEQVQIVSTWRLPGHGDSCRPIYTIMGYTFTVQ
ncbi:hypothetical protein RUR49_02620 [Pseudoxanthobacter sp. M-2]|uniref:hypothetical protein n=1 Tax=Pseudoxanthobacter sp. M-2 TaxID=3078754 RepID=UPI0038FBE499